MNIKHLHYFLAVAKHSSVTRAAEEFGIEQSLMSRHILAIEEKLATQIFIRNNKGMSLTPAGLCFYEHALSLVERYREAIEQIKHLSPPLRPTLNIGVSPYSCSFLEKVLPSFQTNHPEVLVNIAEYGCSELIRRVNERLLDLAFSPSDVLVHMKPSVESFVLSPYQVHLVAHQDHKAMKMASLDALADEFFVTFCEEEGQVFTIKALRDFTAHHFGFSSKNIIRTNSVDALILTLSHRRAVALVPSVHLAKLPKFICPIPTAKSPHKGHFVVLRNHKMPNPAIDAFWELATQLKMPSEQSNTKTKRCLHKT